jgi:hypothetical protein
MDHADSSAPEKRAERSMRIHHPMLSTGGLVSAIDPADRRHRLGFGAITRCVPNHRRVSLAMA